MKQDIAMEMSMTVGLAYRAIALTIAFYIASFVVCGIPIASIMIDFQIVQDRCLWCTNIFL